MANETINVFIVVFLIMSMEKKICKRCGEAKPLPDFTEYILTSGKRERRNICKEYRANDNREKIRKRVAEKCSICKIVKQPKDFVRKNSIDYKEYGRICIECAYQRNIAKKRTIAEQKVKDEDEKGLLLCHSCGNYKEKNQFYKNLGRRRDYDNICRACRNLKNQKRYEETKKILIRLKGDKCSICGNSYPWYAYDFHHVDSKKKESKISQLCKLSYNHLKTLPLYKEEFNKCILVCAICHRWLHLKNRGGDKNE